METMAKRVAKERMPILNTKEIDPSNRLNSRGLTLLEVLVALTLIAGLLSLTLPRLRTGDQTKAIIRKITVLTKHVHSVARLKGLPYRIVVDMGNNSSQSLYVERAMMKEIK